MTFIPPLEMETWFISVLSGSGEIFTSIALFAIISMSAFFRMSGLTMGLMLFAFIAMFSGFIPTSIFILIGIIGGTILGIFIGRIVKT